MTHTQKIRQILRLYIINIKAYHLLLELHSMIHFGLNVLACVRIPAQQKHKRTAVLNGRNNLKVVVNSPYNVAGSIPCL